MYRILAVALTFALAGCQSTAVKPVTADTYNGSYETLNSDPLLSLKVDAPVTIIKDWKVFWEQERKYMVRSPYKEFADSCFTLLTSGVIIGRDKKLQLKVNKCEEFLFDYSTLRDINLPLDMIESWADNNTLNPSKLSKIGDAYHKLQWLSKVFTYYAYNYDQFDISPERRNKIEAYLIEKALKHQPEDAIDTPRTCLSFINAPENWQYGVTPNRCGSVNFKLAIGKVALGLRLGNNEIFQQGVRHTYRMTQYIDKNGVFVPYASKGATAWSYYVDFAGALSRLTELYKTIGFDFLAYKTPHGKTIHEVYDVAFNVLNIDFHIMDSYAKRVNQYQDFHKVRNLTHDEFMHRTTELQLGSFYNSTELDQNGALQFYILNPEYVERFRPDILQTELGGMPGKSEFFYGQPSSVHLANK